MWNVLNGALSISVAMPDETVKECSFCTMNTFHRPNIEKAVARQVTTKVENEFDTTTGMRYDDIAVPAGIAQDGGIKKKKKQRMKSK